MAPRVKADISDEQFKKAIEWLDNGGTKKGACEILGVSNNKTMEQRIAEWKSSQETSARLRKEKRKQACSPEERANLIEAYFDGDSFTDISERFYRSVAYVKHILYLSGALLRENSAEASPLNVPLLPDECVLLEADFRVRERISFEAESLAVFETEKKKILAERGLKQSDIVEVRSHAGKWNPHCAIDIKGETVWLPGYQCLAEVVKEVPSKHGKAFRLYLLDQGNHMYVNCVYWDIGSLRHLELLGAKISSRGNYTPATQCVEAMNEALKKARTQKDNK
ncbi:hypothetical protein [Vibrio phage JSF12]|uniref:D2 protein n=3 Tax=Jesfedecavirus TaxID=2560156 RepID=A0A2D0YNH0_9CAUD|nr:helicase [Vibrio phage phi 3]YP_009618459.1 helicase [Vibrio phage JSF10]YP_009794832.1 helicase [Vibrio phage JSF12]AJF40866.1 D2 protein [Vibrio phage phi 3]ASV43432.1 hypothetical protein [Vibrio phage JSF10]ASV43667.1 hypothetical protein [Vibrio phage JSF12]